MFFGKSSPDKPLFRMYLSRQSFHHISSSLKKTPTSPPLRRTVFTAAAVFRQSQSFHHISSSLKKTSASPPLRRTVFTAAAAIPSSSSLPMIELQLAEIQSKIKAIEFALESFADYENEEERRNFLRQNFTAIPHLKIYFDLAKEALRTEKSNSEKKENALQTEKNALRTEKNTLLEIQLRSLPLPPPPGQ
jgi:hypothetical protein